MVPGDIWTCDTLSTERVPATKRHGTPELIEPTDTSYLGYTQDPPESSETVDSSYVIDNFSDSMTEATAYPLIEFEESDETKNGDKANATYHKEENYLYVYTNSQEQLPSSLMQEYKNIVDSHYKWLHELLSRLHAYNELSATVSGSLTVPIRDVMTVKSTQIITIFASHNRRQNVSLNYLAQSHTEGNELHNDEPTEAVGISDGPQVDSVIATTDDTVSTESALELLIDSLDSDNSIIRISDNLGNKQYLTVERYRALAHRLTRSRTVSVVACTRNVRLPNRTDCNRYYMCEPKTATVVEYSCPLHTAFNVYSRICDVESAKTCGSNRPPANEIFIERIENKNTVANKEEASEERLCQELGKIKDPASDSHYYICYSVPDSEEIKSIRMTCLNTLIFCQDKKVCTTRRLCDVLK